MKKLLLSFCFICFFITTKNVYGQTNVYHPLPDSGYYWNVLDLTIPEFVGDTTYQMLYFTSIYDSIIDGNTYKVFSESYDKINYNVSEFLIREDSILRKIFVRYENSSGGDDFDTILYNFSLNIGDNVSDYWEFQQLIEPNAYVIIKDSIEIEGSYRLRIGISYINIFYGVNSPKEDTLFWIEGIGSTAGWSSKHINPVSDFEGITDILTCFYKNDSVIFSNLEDWYTCDTALIDPVEIAVKSSFLLKIYPNPTKDILLIELLQNIYLDEEVMIQFYDITGKLYYTQKIASQINWISTTDFAKGIYVIKLITESRDIANEKIVIE